MIGIIPATDRVEHIELSLNLEGCVAPHFAGENDELRPALRWIVKQKPIVALPADGSAFAPGKAVFLVIDHDGVFGIVEVKHVRDPLRGAEEKRVGKISE